MTGHNAKIQPGGYLEIVKGALASHNQRVCSIRRLLSSDSVLILYADTEETARISASELRHVSDAKSAPTSTETPRPPEAGSKQQPRLNVGSRVELQDIPPESWDEANRIFKIIEPLLAKSPRTRQDVVDVAAANRVNATTVYAWIKAFESTGHVSGLIKGKPGPRRGSRRLTPDQEAVIEGYIISKYESALQLTPAAAIDDLNDLFDKDQIKRPHPNTIRSRLLDIPRDRALRKRGNRQLAGQLFEQRDGRYLEASAPLQCVQIDHMEVDRIIVDETTRQPLASRPWLTLAIDVHTRMIVGYFLTLLKPSAFSAGVCLYMGMMSKRDVLAELKLPGTWPVFGKFSKIHADNAAEFKGQMLQAACQEHHIDLQLRPTQKPHYGGYIERLVGNVNRQLHKRRGTTHSNPRVSQDYDPKKEAVFTMAETEVDIVDWFVNDYHVNKHASLPGTPLRQWELGIMGDKTRAGIGMPLPVLDPEKLRMDFLPFEKRTIQPDGVTIELIPFSHECLSGWIGALDPKNKKQKRLFVFRIDPRSIRRVWFWDPDLKQYFPIPIADRSMEDISWAEWSAVRRRMKKEGEEATDFESIKQYRARVRQRDAEALARTQAARKSKLPKEPKLGAPAATNLAPASELYAAVPKSSGANAGPQEDDGFDTPVTRFG